MLSGTHLLSIRSGIKASRSCRSVVFTVAEKTEARILPVSRGARDASSNRRRMTFAFHYWKTALKDERPVGFARDV